MHRKFPVTLLLCFMSFFSLILQSAAQQPLPSGEDLSAAALAPFKDALTAQRAAFKEQRKDLEMLHQQTNDTQIAVGGLLAVHILHKVISILPLELQPSPYAATRLLEQAYHNTALYLENPSSTNLVPADKLPSLELRTESLSLFEGFLKKHASTVFASLQPPPPSKPALTETDSNESSPDPDDY